MSPGRPAGARAPSGPPDGAGRAALPTGAARAAILERLGVAPVDEDSLLRDSGLARPSFAATLTELEMDGLVRRAPGGLLSRG
jgi:DNA processing protein